MRALASYAPSHAKYAFNITPGADVAVDADDYVNCGLLAEESRDERIALSTQDDVDALILRCARYALVDSRRAALDSLRDGFLGRVRENGGELDVTVSLAVFTPAEVARLVCGKDAVSAAEIIALVQWPTDVAATKEWGSPRVCAAKTCGSRFRTRAGCASVGCRMRLRSSLLTAGHSIRALVCTAAARLPRMAAEPQRRACAGRAALRHRARRTARSGRRAHHHHRGVQDLRRRRARGTRAVASLDMLRHAVAARVPQR